VLYELNGVDTCVHPSLKGCVQHPHTLPGLYHVPSCPLHATTLRNT
jgi:hypothetical protein